MAASATTFRISHFFALAPLRSVPNLTVGSTVSHFTFNLGELHLAYGCLEITGDRWKMRDDKSQMINDLDYDRITLL